MRTKEIWIYPTKRSVVWTNALALLTILFLAPACSQKEGSDVIGEKSIAVLPFASTSSNQQDTYFADGIQDDLISRLSKTRDLKVISRSSVMPYRDTAKSIETVGEELGVRWILEGGVQRGGEHIRVNIQLIDGSTNKHVWAETYTRELKAENVFAIQAEISKEIAQQLEAIL